MKKRSLAAVGAVMSAGLVLSGCGSTGTEPGNSAAPDDDAPAVGSSWEEIQELAAEEGSLSLAVMSIPGFQEWAAYAKEQLPELDIQITATPFDTLVPRIVTEQNNGAHLWDVIVGPLTNVYAGLHPDHLEEITPILEDLPAKLTDDAAWDGGFHHYSDPDDPRSLITEYLLGTAIIVNRDVISASELSSPEDLLDPEWRGDICINDPRLANQAAMGLAWFLESEEYGEEFVTALLKDQDVQLMDTITNTSESFAMGRCSIAIGADARAINDLKASGLDVDYEVLDGYGNFLLAWGASVLKDAPHPNAARVFLAWFLSEEGQQSYVDMVRTDATTRHLGVEPGPGGEPKADLDNLESYPMRPGTAAGAAAMKRMVEFAEELLN